MAYDANFSESATFNATFAGNAIDAVSNEVIDIRTAYDGTVYPSAGDAVRSQIEEAMESGGGQPTPVSLAENMTDTDKLYLYVGNEEGYTYGDWYYYNKNTEMWVDSGQYGIGAAGADGYSPSASVTQTETGVEITITDEEGTTTATVENGTATDAQVAAWLDEHPEATTTVQDGAITAPKLSGITEPESLFEYEGYYLADSTGVLTANASYAVTRLLPVQAGDYIVMGGRAYGNSYDKKRTYAFYASDGTTVVSCTYTLNELTNGAETYTDTWGHVPDNESIAFLRFTVPVSRMNTSFFMNPKKEETTYTDSSLNATIGAMASGNLVEESVSFSNLDFVKIIPYNKIRYDKRIFDRTLFYNAGKGYSADYPYNGVYETDLVAGKLYWSDIDVKAVASRLICYDTDGNFMGHSYNTTDAESIFESYNNYTINYKTHWEFELKSNVKQVYLMYGNTNAAYSTKKLICLASEYNSQKSVDDYEVETSSEAFAKLVTDLNQTFDASALDGKVWIALGDSYTTQMAGSLTEQASEWGMVVDNRGIVSSSICGDLEGTKGFQPMWNRANTIVSDYTSGYTIGGTSYTANDVRLITFMGGANDGFGVGTWIGTGIHETDKGTIYGACNHIFNVLQENFPNAKIICITQPSNYNRVVSTSVTSDATAQALGFDDMAEALAMSDVQFSNFAMAQKEKAVKETAWAYGLLIIDMFNEFPSIFNPTNRSTYWNSDKLHLTNAGYNIITNAIRTKVEGLFA